MKKRKIIVLILLFSFLFTQMAQSLGQGFEIPTHEQLSEVATKTADLDRYLKNVLKPCYFSVPYSSESYCLGFTEGINQPVFDGKRVVDLVKEGAANEDKPITRSQHHFHNPRLPWNQAGLGWCSLVCESSIVWSQDQNQIVGGKHSWKDARDAYFQALTATTQADRDRYFAETFRTLGHLIHHVQDAATPAHTRNDTHISFGENGGFGNRDNFHFWVRDNGSSMIADLPPLPFDKSLLDQQGGNQFAPLPIARIIDATDGDRGALATGYNIGMAEYSNANFFSDDTVFSPNFVFPATSNLEPHAPVIDPVTGQTRTYLHFTANSGGQTDYKVAHISALKLITNEAVAQTDLFLDDAVMNDYAKKLLPRAVSYSTGLIDHFFRTGLFFGGWMGTPPYTIDPSTIGFGHLPAEWFGSYENSALTEHAETGRIVVTIHYSHSGQSHYFTLMDAVRTFQLDNASGSDFTETEVIDLNPMWQQIPEGASEVYGIVVYRGPLGQEEDAVIGGVGWFLAPPM